MEPAAPALIRLDAAAPFAAGALLGFLAARAIPGVETVDGATYRRRLRAPHGVASVAVTVDAGGADVAIDADARDHGEVLARVRRLLDLEADPVAIDAWLSRDPQLAPLVAARPGVRSPGALDGPEVLVRAIAGQQIAVAAARTVLGRLAADHGDDGCFAPAARLAACDPGTLPMPRARARALVGAMAAVAADPSVLDDAARLVALPGVGPWTAAYVRLRLGDADAFLPTDLVARRAMTALGMERGRDERWSPYRAYALHRLWLFAAPRADP